MREQSASVIQAAKRIKLIAFDVDGVLTDGRITYTSAGEEIKSFNVRDGHAIKMAFRAGLTVAVITGRDSPMVQKRCEELGIENLYQGIRDKASCLEILLSNTKLSAKEVAYMGDDIVDLPIMSVAGLGCCPSDAAEEVQQRSDLVTGAPGGGGAARELIFFILQQQGLLEELMQRYIS